MNQKKAAEGPKQTTGKRFRKEIVLKTVLCTLVCLWMFVLGLLVGRGTAPVRFNIKGLQDKLSDLKAATVDETTRHYQIAFQELDRKMDLGFHEALKDDKSDLSSSTKPLPVAPAPTAPAVKPESEAPKKTKDSDRKAETPDASNPWEIQVAATQSEVQGKQLVQQLEKMGLEAYLMKVAIPNKGIWYRIRVRGYTTREAAEKDVARLKKEHFSPMIISP